MKYFDIKILRNLFIFLMIFNFFFTKIHCEIELIKNTNINTDEKECNPGTELIDGRCSSCGGNYFNPKKGGTCRPCPINTYTVMGYGNSKCDDCPPGMIGRGEGQGCASCNRNYFKPEYGAGECRPCPLNTYTVSPYGNRKCDDCPPGTIGRGEGQGCASCNRNYFKPEYGAGECRPCPLNTYTVSPYGNRKCDDCPSGYGGKNIGEGCKKCNENEFSPGNADIYINKGCRECPAGSTSNKNRSDCENEYDFTKYLKDYIFEKEAKLKEATKCTISNFRQFFKSLNFDYNFKDFSNFIDGIKGDNLAENLENFSNFLKSEQIGTLIAQRLQPEIMNFFDKNIKKLPNLSNKELKSFFKSLKIWGGVSHALEKSVSVVGFAAAITEDMMNNFKNKAKMSKWSSDFITDSTKFFYVEAISEGIAASLITAGGLEIVVGGVIIAYSVNYLADNLEIYGKTPVEYYLDIVEELTSGLDGSSKNEKLLYLQ